MKDPFEELLYEDEGVTREVSPETLEMLGKEAASMYLNEGIPLNDAIVKLASEHEDLNDEHVKRIIEFANTEVFQQKFQNDEDKNVHFPVADPNVIFNDLKSGGSPSLAGPTEELDYSYSPSYLSSRDNLAKVASQKDEVLVEPTLPPSHHHPIEDVYDLYVTLQGQLDELKVKAASATESMDKAADSLYSIIRENISQEDGDGFGDLARALRKVASDQEIIDVMTVMAARLVKDGVSSFEKLAADASQHNGKSLVNTDHPLFSSFLQLKKAASEKFKLDDMIANLNGRLEEIKNFIVASSREA